MESKFCTKCGAPVESDYIFCAVCGNDLRNVVKSSTENEPTGENVNADATQNSAFDASQNTGYKKMADTVANALADIDNIEGIPSAEIKDYVGKKGENYFQKFVKFGFGAKANWNWPTFILSVLGLPFVWFFHRKMNKVGAIVLSIWLAITAANSFNIAITLSAVEDHAVNMIAEAVELGNEYGVFDSTYIDEYTMDEYERELDKLSAEYVAAIVEDVQSEDFVVVNLISQLCSYINIAMLIILPMFADYWYYKKAMKDLHALNENGFPDAKTVIAKGGTSVGAVVLTGIVGLVVPLVATCAALIPFVVNVIEYMSNII